MERVEPPKGYVFRDEETVKELMAIEADLLRSEGIDPAWPGFADRSDDEAKTQPGGAAEKPRAIQPR